MRFSWDITHANASSLVTICIANHPWRHPSHFLITVQGTVSSASCWVYSVLNHLLVASTRSHGVMNPSSSNRSLLGNPHDPCSSDISQWFFILSPPLCCMVILYSSPAGRRQGTTFGRVLFGPPWGGPADQIVRTFSRAAWVRSDPTEEQIKGPRSSLQGREPLFVLGSRGPSLLPSVRSW